MNGRFEQLKEKFYPVFLEMDRRKVRLKKVDLRGEKLYMRAEGDSPEDVNYVMIEIRVIDPDLEEVIPELSVVKAQG